MTNQEPVSGTCSFQLPELSETPESNTSAICLECWGSKLPTHDWTWIPLAGAPLSVRIRPAPILLGWSLPPPATCSERPHAARNPAARTAKIRFIQASAAIHEGFEQLERPADSRHKLHRHRGLKRPRQGSADEPPRGGGKFLPTISWTPRGRTRKRGDQWEEVAQRPRWHAAGTGF